MLPERERLNRAIAHLEKRRTEITDAIAANAIDEDEIRDVLNYVARIRTGFSLLQADPVFRDRGMRLFRVRVQLDECGGRKLALISCELGSDAVDIEVSEGDIDTFVGGLFDT